MLQNITVFSPYIRLVPSHILGLVAAITLLRHNAQAAQIRIVVNQLTRQRPDDGIIVMGT
jgi:hypothetical protein